MAEEAFALSPINARPNLPGEADYEAIREAFMETARGRWFLAEYTRRNRNADTNLLLEAVSRLETNLAAQKQPPQGLSLTAALGAIRSAVRHAKATAIEVLPRGEGDEVQTSARSGVQIVREIARTLRECGADIRICDLLDTQVRAIEAGHVALQAQTPESSRNAVLASYDALMERIEALADGAIITSAKADPAPAAEQTPEPREASVTPLFKANSNASVAEAHAETMRMPEPVVAPAPAAETVVATATPAAADEAPIAPSGSMLNEEIGTATETSFDAEEAEDLAVLDAVAMEMGAIDFDEPDSNEPIAAAAETAPIQNEAALQPPIAQPSIADEMTLAQIAQAALTPEVAQAEPVAQAAPVAAPSLGAALIASGVIANPAAPAPDPLAPIRRMTQAEKIAFFS